MNCEDFESNVNDLAREQIMEASVRATTLAHRDECEACARRLEDESALGFKLRALATDTRAEHVPAMGKELLAALRDRQPRMIPAAAGAFWSNRAKVAGMMALAAMVLVVIAVALIRSRPVTPAAQNLPNSPGPQNLPDSGSDIVKAADIPLPLVNKKTGLANRRAGRRNARRNVNRIVEPSLSIANSDSKDFRTIDTATTGAENDATEITTDFMPVGYASAAHLEEGGQLVRVELPRSALVAFGLPMNVNRYDEKVKADVFFGSDGMARAIRFVQ